MSSARANMATPVCDTGWYRDRIGIVEISYVHGRMTERSFDHFLSDTCRSIDECPEDEQIPLFLEVREPALLNARWRKRLASAIKARTDKLARVRPAFVMVTSSLVARTAQKVVHWMAPPPYPHAAVGSVREGCEFMARCVPGVDARALQAEYERRRAACLAARAQG